MKKIRFKGLDNIISDVEIKRRMKELGWEQVTDGQLILHERELCFKKPSGDDDGIYAYAILFIDGGNELGLFIAHEDDLANTYDFYPPTRAELKFFDELGLEFAEGYYSNGESVTDWFHMAHDDAISDQSEILNTAIRTIDDYIRFFERSMKNYKDELEVDVDLSDQSPFKNLSAEDLKDRKKVNELWKQLPRFMYFEEELLKFEKEYKSILEAILAAEKKFMIKSLTGTITWIDKRMTDEERLDSNLAVKLINRIRKMSETLEVPFDINRINNVRTPEELSKVLKEEREKIK